MLKVIAKETPDINVFANDQHLYENSLGTLFEIICVGSLCCLICCIVSRIACDRFILFFKCAA